MSTPRNITVLGSGIMGPGIAAVFARSGADVTIYDVVQDALDRAAEGVKVAEGVLDKLDAARGDRQGELSFTTSIEEALAKAEYVLEAVPEREDLKKQVIAQVESLVGPEVIIASNTSGIPITKLAEDMKHPERFVGMHWSNPPHVIPLIEVVPGEQTSDATRDAVVALANSFGYEAVLEGEVPGFVENRILYAIMRESLALVDEGIISKEDMDICVRWGIGFKLAVVGPMRLLDMAGLDTYNNVASYLNRDLSKTDGVPQVITDNIEAQTFGFKSGKGLFEYGEGDVAAKRAQIVSQLIQVRNAMPKPLSSDQV
ncbi:3-hydroxyacyl-CoA dehydrogenase NAD-binding domain-containing protein [Leucobacter denitrificans]|uniref:3-hydroxyacyl-CoA dehydrogenase NAD-binding domain-containing protein n=2 Tax=Leucobacter denitrificans TaxID=683042 RepID=UPI003614E3EC